MSSSATIDEGVCIGRDRERHTYKQLGFDLASSGGQRGCDLFSKLPARGISRTISHRLCAFQFNYTAPLDSVKNIRILSDVRWLTTPGFDPSFRNRGGGNLTSVRCLVSSSEEAAELVLWCAMEQCLLLRGGHSGRFKPSILIGHEDWGINQILFRNGVTSHSRPLAVM